ncbi:MAG: LacI family DNA-binding transcriptional regulator [Geodermatophilaceae bacterium]
MVTSRHVAQAAGVSQATVSRVLQGSDKVRDATRERVLEAVSRTGYSPNILARAMKTHRTGTIGVVVARITNPFYPEVLEALSAELARAGQNMVLWTSEGAGNVSALEAIRAGMADGVIFTTVTAESMPLQEALKRQAPLVMLNRSVEGLPCDQVTSDNVSGSRAIAEYFVAGGHRRLGFIGGPPRPSTSVERKRGFREGLASAGIPWDETLCRYGDFSHADGRAAIRELLSLDEPPTAVFCVNDLTGLGALDGARSLGRRIPQDVWLAGYDDIAMSAWDAFDLTTVRQPIAEMVALAVRMLLERIADPSLPPRHHRFPSELVARGSTGGKRAHSTPRPPLPSSKGKGAASQRQTEGAKHGP